MSDTERLEQRIIAVLNDPNSASSDEVGQLIVDNDAAIAKAEQEIIAARELSQDITKTPLPAQAADARRAAEEAALTRDRLAKIEPALRDRYTASLATERKARWQGYFEMISAEREVLAVEFDEFFGRIRSELAALNTKIREFNGEVGYVNRFGGEIGQWGHQLDPLPLIAPLRTLDSDTARNAPDWRAANAFAASFAQSMVPAAHPGAAWGEPENQAQRRAEVEKEQQRLASFYEQQTADQEARQNQEERERFAATSNRAS
ncbi:MAG TPA: hypothetical protein VFB02_16575 [Bradyrhizobium sp.]|nr:hypothetical protein [Bradyrhizobium sp.]